nr:uncharacterized protein LOC129264658 [Lytechinus pictus]
MEGFIGYKCAEAGLTTTNIASKISQVTLTNGMVVELASVMNSDLWKSLGTELKCNPVSLNSAMGRVKEKFSKLKKNATTAGKKALEEYLAMAFNLPQRRETKQKMEPSKPQCRNCVGLVRSLETFEKKKEESVHRLQKKLEECEKKRSEDRRSASKKLKALYSIIGEVGCPKDVIQNFKRLRSSRSMWQCKFQALNSTYTRVQSLHRRAVNRCKLYKSRLDRLRSKKSKEPRCKQPKQRPPGTLGHVDYIDDLHRNIDELEVQVESFTKPLCTKEGKEYSSSIRQVSYFLQVSIFCCLTIK